MASLPDGGPLVRKRGQTMVEYVVVAGMLLASAAIFALLLATYREYGSRVLALMGSEYP